MRVSSGGAESKVQSEKVSSKSTIKKKSKSSKEAEGDAPDARVELTSKKDVKKTDVKKNEETQAAAPKRTEEQEMKDAETLMDHVNSGKLSDHERDLAMKRVGEVLKKYGNA